MFGNLETCTVTLKLGKVHVLGDALSRAHHAKKEAIVNYIEVHKVSFQDVITSYEDHQNYGPVFKALKVK